MRKVVLFIVVLAVCFLSCSTPVWAAKEKEWQKIYPVEGETYFLGIDWTPEGVLVWDNRVREGIDPNDMEFMMGCVPENILFNDSSLGDELIPVPYMTGINTDFSDELVLKDIYQEGGGFFSCTDRKPFQSARFTNKDKTTYKKGIKTDWACTSPRIVLPNNKGILSSLTSGEWALHFLGGHSYPAKAKWINKSEEEVLMVFSFRIKENRFIEDVERMVLCKDGIPTPWFSGTRIRIADRNFVRKMYLNGTRGNREFSCAGVENLDLALYPSNISGEPYSRVKWKKSVTSPVLVIPAK